MKYPVSKNNVANFGEVNYKVELVEIYTGWIIEIIETPGEETLYHVMYEDTKEEDLTLSELDNHKLVSTNKASLAKLTKTPQKRRPRRKACGKCTECKKEDCGTCLQCKDMPKFGGQNLRREKCKNRKCRFMS